MKKYWRYLGMAASAALLTSCGGSGSEPAASNTTDTAAVNEPAAAPGTAPAGPAPAADSTDTIDGTKLADFTPDVAHGKIIFTQCQACHSRDEGVNKIGPSLAGVVGRKASTVAGFQYSEANHNSGITWTPEKLFQYLENPQRIVPGTKMAFPGLPKGQDRADVIAYLQGPK